jgi:hypothetical protein
MYTSNHYYIFIAWIGVWSLELGLGSYLHSCGVVLQFVGRLCFVDGLLLFIVYCQQSKDTITNLIDAR